MTLVSVDRLKDFPVFAKLAPAVLDRLAAVVSEEEHSAGSTVFAEGRGGDAVFFITQGEVLIRKSLDKTANAFKVIALLSRGEFFGEMALLEQLPRSASAVAQTSVSLLRLSTAEFNRWLETDPASALQFFRGLVVTLSGRLRQTTREMVAVFEVGRTLVQELDAKGLAARVLTLVRNSFEADDVFGAFYRWNEFVAEYELAAFEGDWPQALRTNRSKADLLFHTMAVKRECVLSHDWSKDDRFSDAVRSMWPGLVSFLAAPVIGLKGPVGFIVFGHGAKAGLFASGHRQVLAGVSNLIAPAFENAAWRQEMESKRRLDRAKTVAY